MNPRHRRYLIPGLLVTLLVVAALVSLAREAEGAEGDGDAQGQGSTTSFEEVSTVTDPRIAESSGLAVSAQHDDLAYTINDSGNDDVVYAFRISTGEVVGATRVTGTSWRDTEALALVDGTLWVADVGDNQGVRDDLALYAVEEPGPGDGTAGSTRYPVAYPDGARDAESLAPHPDGGFVLVSKEIPSGELFRLGPDLTTDATNVAEPMGVDTLLLATDAATSPDGRFLVVRNYIGSVVLTLDGEVVRDQPLPEQPQGETLAFEPDGTSFLVGTEGSPWALHRVAFPEGGSQPGASPEPSAGVTDAATDDVEPGVGRPQLSILGGVVGVVILAAVAAWAVRREQ